jgi:hypothetical protein
MTTITGMASLDTFRWIADRPAVIAFEKLPFGFNVGNGHICRNPVQIGWPSIPFF